jgi:4-amino-4-deoxychorismate lyase
MNSPLCIETICLNDGQLSNLTYHNERLNRTRSAYFGEVGKWDLNELISIPLGITAGLYKCRVTYGKAVEKIEFEPYRPRQVKSLRLVEDDSIAYDFKFKDRTALQYLFEKRGNADDVLIVKQGLLTDSSYANLVFWNGKQWVTPDSPLLKGTKRARLLVEGLITEQKIRAQDLPKYSHARLINSMLDFDTTPDISVENIQ